jgi:hypothetical protein
MCPSQGVGDFTVLLSLLSLRGFGVFVIALVE